MSSLLVQNLATLQKKKTTFLTLTEVNGEMIYSAGPFAVNFDGDFKLCQQWRYEVPTAMICCVLDAGITVSSNGSCDAGHH